MSSVPPTRSTPFPTIGYERPVHDGPPARSTVGAALLNLGGLGVGFAYLRRWVAASACLATTGGLVALAFLTDAADLPLLWVVLAVLWSALAVGAAAVLGRRHPRPASAAGRVLPVAAGVLLVAAMVAGFVAYRSAGSAVFAEGRTAQAAADCATAVERFDTVDGPFELTLSADVPAARAGRAQCQAYLAATDAAQRGDHAAAVRGYQDFRSRYPGSVLVPYAADDLQDTYHA
jgi:hypothetical protein